MLPEHIGHRGISHRHSRVPGVGRLDRVNGEEAYRINRHFINGFGLVGLGVGFHLSLFYWVFGERILTDLRKKTMLNYISGLREKVVCSRLGGKRPFAAWPRFFCLPGS